MDYSRFEFSQLHKKAIELFEQGYGYKATATLLSVNPNTVRDWARNWRVNVNYNAEGTPEEKAKAVSMRASGASLMTISAELRISKRRITAWLAEAKASASTEEKEAV
ncbi:MAG: helix-turn-helix domain-containing protein [Sutterella wadsworthensis]